jgi:hypothetical protein
LTVHLRIFLSSPGDVAEERQLARDAIAELAREPQFETAKLEPISWDDPQGRTPLVAQLDPQAAVARGLPKPSECDAVVGIFWARMGSPLPPDKYQKADGSAYLSGTEYELEDALRVEAGPDVLLYRRSEEPLWGARDSDWREKQEQLARVDAYLERLKAVPRYVDLYSRPSDLKEHLKSDLRKVLAKRLKRGPGAGFSLTDPAGASGGHEPPAVVVDLGRTRALEAIYSKSAADLAFTITNLSDEPRKVDLALAVTKIEPSSKVRLKKAAAVLAEYDLILTLGPVGEYDLLKNDRVQIIVGAAQSDAFRLSLRGRDGHIYTCDLIARFRKPGTDGPPGIVKAAFTVDFPKRL